jgi:hypothetical protein
VNFLKRKRKNNSKSCSGIKYENLQISNSKEGDMQNDIRDHKPANPEKGVTYRDGKIIYDGECNYCGGTGLYIGSAERDGAAVVCNKCGGSGKIHIEEKLFIGKKVASGVKRVYEKNPGFYIGTDSINKLEDFGGLSYHDWINGKEFGIGTEMRNCVCPRHWYYSKPDWLVCKKVYCVDRCTHWINKSACWKRFDEEELGKKSKK